VSPEAFGGIERHDPDGLLKRGQRLERRIHGAIRTVPLTPELVV
jgi:hypothetical protein